MPNKNTNRTKENLDFLQELTVVDSPEVNSAPRGLCQSSRGTLDCCRTEVRGCSAPSCRGRARLPGGFFSFSAYQTEAPSRHKAEPPPQRNFTFLLMKSLWALS